MNKYHTNNKMQLKQPKFLFKLFKFTKMKFLKNKVSCRIKVTEKIWWVIVTKDEKVYWKKNWWKNEKNWWIIKRQEATCKCGSAISVIGAFPAHNRRICLKTSGQLTRSNYRRRFLSAREPRRVVLISSLVPGVRSFPRSRLYTCVQTSE